MGHHYLAGSDSQRFGNMYIAFIEMQIRGYVGTEIFNIFSLVNNMGINQYIDMSLSNGAQSIVRTAAFFPFLSYLNTVLLAFTSLDPIVLNRIPIAAFIFPPIIFALYSKFGGRYALPLYIALLIYLLQHKIFMSSYVAAYCYPLLFTYILLLFIMFNSRVEEGANKNFYPILGIITMLALANYWHSVAMMAIIFTISLLLVSVMIEYVSSLFNDKIFFKNAPGFFLFAVTSLIVGIVFNKTWDSYSINEIVGSNPIDTLYSNLVNKIAGGIAYEIDYKYNYADALAGEIYLYDHLLIHIISGVILILPLIVIFGHLARNRNYEAFFTDPSLNKTIIWIFAIILAQVTFSLLYSITAFGFVYVPFLFPIIGAYGLRYLDEINHSVFKKIASFLVIILIISSVILTTSTFVSRELGQNSMTMYKDMDPSLQYINQNIGNKVSIFVDFNLFGKYIIQETKLQKPSLDFIRIGSESYGEMVGDSKTDIIRDSYFIIDFKTMSNNLPFHVYEGRSMFVPLLDRIENNEEASKIYNDRIVNIFVS